MDFFSIVFFFTGKFRGKCSCFFFENFHVFFLKIFMFFFLENFHVFFENFLKFYIFFKVPVAQEAITLGDFKRYINKPNYKFFFQSYDDDFGLVKEEITKDNSILPKTQEGKIVCFLTPGEVDKKQVGIGENYRKFEKIYVKNLG